MAALSPTSRRSQASTTSPSQLIFHITQVSNYLKTCRDSHAAHRHLAVIRHDTPLILDVLKKREFLLEAKRDDLRRVEDGLHRTIGIKEETKARMKRTQDALLAKRTRDRAALESAQLELRTMHVRKVTNQVTRNVAIGSTVSTGVATVVLGIIFPPTLIVTIPVTAVMGTTAVAAGVAVELYKERISNIEEVLVALEVQIRIAAFRIQNIENTISDLNRKLNTLYKERGELRDTIVFIQKSVSYFAELQVVVKGGHLQTNRLHEMVARANKEEQYAILNSRGGTTIVNSFAKAWKLVEDKFLSGSEAGYLRIKLITNQKLL